MIPKNIKMIPESIRSNKELIQDALDFGCAKAKVISTKAISLAHVKATVSNNGWPDVIQHKPCSDSHPIGMILLN